MEAALDQGKRLKNSKILHPKKMKSGIIKSWLVFCVWLPHAVVTLNAHASKSVPQVVCWWRARVNLKKSCSGDKIDKQAPFAMGRYTVVKLLGSGTYGKVVEAEDEKYNKTHVALKLVEPLLLFPVCTFLIYLLAD
jgi:hypothetical protein